MKKIIGIHLLLLIALSAQDIFTFDYTNSPLPKNSLSCVAVDSQNVIWVGTVGGVYRYDFRSWVKYDSKLGIDTTISSLPNVSDIEVSDDNTVWLGIMRGNSNNLDDIIYSFKNDKWIGYSFDLNLRDPLYFSIENETLYMALTNYWNQQLGNNAVGILKDDSLTIIDPENVYGTNSVAHIYGDTLITADWEGIHLYDGNNWILSNPEGWQPNHVSKLNDEIYVTGERICKYKNHSYVEFPLIDSVLQKDTSKITAVTADDENILWIGTDKGKLIKYNNEIELFELTGIEIADITVDKDGNKWIIAGQSCILFNETKIVDVKNEKSISNDFHLSQNYPNPFNPSTKIKFSIPSVETPYMVSLQQTKLVIYDLLGREVKILLKKNLSPGSYEVKFDGSNLSSGVYFYKLEVGNNYNQTKKMLLIK